MKNLKDWIRKGKTNAAGRKKLVQVLLTALEKDTKQRGARDVGKGCAANKTWRAQDQIFENEYDQSGAGCRTSSGLGAYLQKWEAEKGPGGF